MKTELRIEKIDVKIGGIAPIMFDRFVDHSKEARPADQKLYPVAQRFSKESETRNISGSSIAMFFSDLFRLRFWMKRYEIFNSMDLKDGFIFTRRLRERNRGIYPSSRRSSPGRF